ncbi:hypothetical protein RHGRI_037647 [Rhododendron griersonianum]|uniref:GDSL esterase/lipase n=1 Tax=Rhododendron griersonianum TaxID=479676 RepID=A0AAV6HSK1_9ERIC|nr:hypothetical protein RHGRI_037647 [Rhododendron griersonianum]
MSSSHIHWLNALHLQCFSLVMSTWVLFNISNAQAQGPVARQKALKNSVNAIFVFADSTADPGNNNYVTTIFKGNFPPYGRDFPNQVPTGRFTNGRLAYDFVASYVGIKEYVPPYLDPTLSIEELMTGVSFASDGSRFDPLTPQLSVGLLLFVVIFFCTRKRYSLPDYMEFLLQQVQQFIQFPPYLTIFSSVILLDFDEVSSGCCGTGLLEASYLCNSDSYVCSDASKYVFWDSIHPSEKAYKLLFEATKSRIDFLITDD